MLKMGILLSPVWGYFSVRVDTFAVPFYIPRRFGDDLFGFGGGEAGGCVSEGFDPPFKRFWGG